MMRTTRISTLVLLSCLVAVPLPAGQSTNGQGNPADRAQQRVQRFRAMDANKDGVITRSEWRGNERSFERHDTNRDGVLSGTEVWPAGVPEETAGTSGTFEPGDPADPLTESFLRADRNHDGIISRDEWTSDPATFTRVDTNRDGVITRPEYLGQGWTDDSEVTAAPAEARRNTHAYQAGFDRGLADGRQAGKEDKALRNSWDLEGQRELEQADAGYEPAMGARTDYQAGYRAGFSAGYRQGFGPRE